MEPSDGTNRGDGGQRTLRRALKTVVRRAGLMAPYLRWREWRISRMADAPPATAPDGLPLPDRYLITLIAGTGDWRWFYESGRQAADAFADLFAEFGRPVECAGRILDFGCGVGRIARHIAARTRAELTGVDYNGQLVAWCAANLPGAYRRNSLAPPLDLAADRFDLVYAYSVFTHLRPALQESWLGELSRVTAPGGIVIITFHDEDHVNLPATAAEALERQGIHVHQDVIEGSNFTATFQTRAQAAVAFGRCFDVLRIVPSPQSGVTQAIAVLRKR